jgi:hypothetical protein
MSFNDAFKTYLNEDTLYVGDTTLDENSFCDLLSNNMNVLKLNIHGDSYFVDMCKNKLTKMIKLFEYIAKTTTDEYILIELLSIDGLLLKYVKDQTERICISAVKSRGYALQYVINQTYDICMESVKENGRALQFVHDKNDDIILEALKTTYDALKYVNEDEQTLDICLKSLEYSNGSSFPYIHDKTDEILNKTCEMSPIYVLRCKNTPNEFIEKALLKDPRLIYLTEYRNDIICKHVVSHDGMLLKYMNEDYQTFELCEIAVRNNPNAIKFVIHKNDHLASIALEKDGLLLQHIFNQNDYICDIALRQNPLAIKYVIDQNDYLNSIALEKNGLLLQYITDQNTNICDIALRQNPEAIYFVNNNLKCNYSSIMA